jgi:hypothetical protein
VKLRRIFLAEFLAGVQRIKRVEPMGATSL